MITSSNASKQCGRMQTCSSQYLGRMWRRIGMWGAVPETNFALCWCIGVMENRSLLYWLNDSRRYDSVGNADQIGWCQIILWYRVWIPGSQSKFLVAGQNYTQTVPPLTSTGPFSNPEMGSSNSSLGLGNSRPSKRNTALDSSAGPWKITALMDGWKPCRQLRAILCRLCSASWKPAHPDHDWPAQTQPISHQPIYVNVTKPVVKQPQLDGIKIWQYGRTEGNE